MSKKQPTATEVADVVAGLQDSRHIYTTKGGEQIELLPIPQLQAERVREGALRKAAELYGEAVKPTYTIEDTGETFEHDEESIKDAGDDVRAAWAKWQETVGQHEAYVNRRMMEFFFYHGIKADPDADTAWEEEQKFFDIDIPSNPVERKIHYVQTRYIYDREDMEQITLRMLQLAGAREEVIEAAENTFRGTVGQA